MTAGLRSAAKSLSLVRLCVTPWTAAYQAPPSIGFSRQGYCSGQVRSKRDKGETQTQFSDRKAILIPLYHAVTFKRHNESIKLVTIK